MEWRRCAPLAHAYATKSARTCTRKQAQTQALAHAELRTRWHLLLSAKRVAFVPWGRYAEFTAELMPLFLKQARPAT